MKPAIRAAVVLHLPGQELWRVLDFGARGLSCGLGEGRQKSLTGSRVGGKLPPIRAGLAQLVERQLPKLDVAGSSPVSRSIFLPGRSQRPAQPFPVPASQPPSRDEFSFPKNY